MKKIIKVYKHGENTAKIEQLDIKRNWMDETDGKHAYQCMPISLANTMGWGISFPEDISFIWNGVCDSNSSNVKIIEGDRYCSTLRGNGTISFNTYLTFTTEKKTTMLIFPVPNEFNENAQCFTSLISTSFYKSMLPIAWRITKANKKITIKAGTPVATIIPISLSELEDFEINITKDLFPTSYYKEIMGNLEFFKKQASLGKFSKLYRKAKNYKGESVGAHEVNTLRLTTRQE
jgi:hypothetical protein